jgi:ADP-heptose:LPS heptosyltransferase
VPSVHPESEPWTIRATSSPDVDLVLEATIFADQSYSGEIVEARWLQFEFNQQANAYQEVHENLLSLLARGGVVGAPDRPSIRHNPVDLEQARKRLLAAGIDCDRELVLVVQPAAGAKHKCWSPRNMASFCSRAKRRLGARIVLCPGPATRP